MRNDRKGIPKAIKELRDPELKSIKYCHSEDNTLHEKLYNRVSDYVSVRMITPSNREISGIISLPII